MTESFSLADPSVQMLWVGGDIAIPMGTKSLTCELDTSAWAADAEVLLTMQLSLDSGVTWRQVGISNYIKSWLTEETVSHTLNWDPPEYENGNSNPSLRIRFRVNSLTETPVAINCSISLA